MDKIVINMCNQDPVNNFGFNLANFSPDLVQNNFGQVVHDYERSFIGAFVSALFESNPTEIEMTCAKFVGTEGYTLTPSNDETKVPVYSPVGSLSEFYKLMSSAVVRNGDQNINDNCIVLQFRQGKKTVTFVNLVCSPDVNIQTLTQVLQKDNRRDF